MDITQTADPGWLLVEEGFNLAREHEIESLLTVANGYVGVRGSLAEGSRLSSPATMIAGVFDVAPQSDRTNSLRAIPELVTAPHLLRLRVIVDGHALTLEEGEWLEHRRVLDICQGILWRVWRHRDSSGRVTDLRFLRFASLADRHVLFQSFTLTPANYSGKITLESVIEAEHPSSEALPALVPASHALAAQNAAQPGADAAALELHTRSTGIAVAFAAASEMRTESEEHIPRQVETGAGRLIERWTWDAEMGKTYRLDRLVSLHTSRDAPQPALVAAQHLERLPRDGMARVMEAHVRAWETHWQTADIQVEGDAQAQRALRFAAYHLISAANPEDERVSIGARALTGAGYKGHVFWDAETYMLPFFVFTNPPAARALLMYRYHTLPAAREKARTLGYRGALYAWESADSGAETTPPWVLTPEGKVVRILTGEQEHHVSADIAYGVWQYWQASGDDAFFLDGGAEIILETARFWASRGRIEADGRYHLQQVIGPDEYHEAVDDNAYTNVMAQWNLERGAETVRLLQERWSARWEVLARRLGITAEETETWRRLATAMYTGLDPSTGLWEQFRGYFDLEEIDLTGFSDRAVPMDVLLGAQRIRQSKVIKQADVVLLLHLLWDRFPPAAREANFRYYEPRTGHGSSLSPAIHALVAARLGDAKLAERYFKQAAEIDLANNMGNAAGGIHAAALGGLWQAAVFGFAGLRLREDGLVFDPHLPRGWHRLRFTVQWRSQRLRVNVSAEPLSIEVRLEGHSPTTVGLASGPQGALLPGRSYRARREHATWSQWQEMPAHDLAKEMR